MFAASHGGVVQRAGGALRPAGVRIDANISAKMVDFVTKNDGFCASK